MDSLISRQAAIDMFNRLADDPWNANANTTWSKAYEYAAEMIEEMPPAQPDLSDYSDRLWKAAYERGKAEAEPRWIPVTERLPEADKRVLICNDEGRYLIGFVKDLGDYWPSEWRYQFDMYDDDVYEEQEQGKIVAWMPLPKPYERSEDE